MQTVFTICNSTFLLNKLYTTLNNSFGYPHTYKIISRAIISPYQSNKLTQIIWEDNPLYGHLQKKSNQAFNLDKTPIQNQNPSVYYHKLCSYPDSFSAAISSFMRTIISASSVSHSSRVLAYTLCLIRLPFACLGKKLPSQRFSLIL